MSKESEKALITNFWVQKVGHIKRNRRKDPPSASNTSLVQVLTNQKTSIATQPNVQIRFGFGLKESSLIDRSSIQLTE